MCLIPADRVKTVLRGQELILEESHKVVEEQERILEENRKVIAEQERILENLKTNEIDWRKTTLQ